MKIYKISENLKSKMEDWYKQRTNKHIELVQKYCRKIIEKFDEYDELKERLEVHDDSKFEEPEKTPYVFITWKYKCKEDDMDFEKCNPPEDIDDQMYEATIHHITTNSHHPEFHAPNKDDHHALINKENRDKPPEEMIDATKMPDMDIAEMCADWCSVSEERGNSPKDWAKKNINVRWKFNKHQEDLIYDILDEIWE